MDAADTDMTEAGPSRHPAAVAQPPGLESIQATLSHGGRFIQYNIFGNVFEVTSKYKPPIMPIGKGAYGIVCSAFNSETGEQVAIKKIANAFDNKIDAKRTLREIKLLRHMDHENVVAIRDIIPTPQREPFNDVYIAYELMDTDLHQIIRSNQSLSEEHCQYFLYQILRGLKYIHSASVLHRDLKPSNLLLNANCDLKICDFGLARTTSETDFMTEYVVTRWYRAPELLLNSSEYTTAIDVWSVGCIFMELMDRKPLFPGRDHVHQLRLLMEQAFGEMTAVKMDLEGELEQIKSGMEVRLSTIEGRFGSNGEGADGWACGEGRVDEWRPAAGWVMAGGWGGQGRAVLEGVRLRERKGATERVGWQVVGGGGGVELIGTPDEADLGYVNENARRYINQLPRHRPQSFHEKFPHVHPQAIDLVEKMLTFDPRKRLTVEEALEHPYLASLHDISDEPVCLMPFSFDFEQHALSEEQMKELIYREALAFNPEYQLI
ncbi:hypothetical protein IEQ34_021130 [Dendrobium chrysotoxum]|uniref:Mitogen-activated protein kinase n=1 Tax=Dendrobium chrysotoxum TaxID=161865 RepID=A0AAV7G4X6_DENCH|nr:hypothetical protein IEQ34_021130 [Dendrobium chrysotoxum]